MTKEPEYHVGCGLFGVYAGTLMKPKKDGMIMWRKKSDVTEEAIHAVMQYFKQTMDGHEALSDGLTASYAGDFLCTSYDLNCDVCQTTNITYSGEAPIPGYTVAADLSTFPIGTWLYIEGLGIRRVTDTGGGVGKNQLDVLVAGNHDDAKVWQGYGMHRVWILEGVE